MSADNGIYVARFKNKYEKYEYRVADCQAIDNCQLPYMNCKTCYASCQCRSKHCTDEANAFRYLYFKDSTVFDSCDKATVYAIELYNKEMKDVGGIVEYGIGNLIFDVPFPDLTDEQANKILNEDWHD